jgi:hypothetical protein
VAVLDDDRLTAMVMPHPVVVVAVLLDDDGPGGRRRSNHNDGKSERRHSGNEGLDHEGLLLKANLNGANQS